MIDGRCAPILNKKKEEQSLAKEEIRIAGILDEITEEAVLKVCRFTNLESRCWREQIEAVLPLFLFVESAWRGKANSWYQKVSSVQKELCELIGWCKQRSIPTVFWNKEDPVHFQTFFPAAALFDWVFTTELDCVPVYKQLLGHLQVGYLPFAADITEYNPLSEGRRKDAICFAGSYYVGQKQRCKEFDQIYSICKEYMPFDIYARMPGKGNPDYAYPKKYEESIKASIPVNRIGEVYKSYRYAVTLNTVTKGSTMFARRAVEIGACNTLLLSNYCRGLHTLFGELILYNEDKESFRRAVSSLPEKEKVYRKLRLALYRKILLEHTYEHRLSYLCSMVIKKERKKSQASVLIFSVVQNEEQEKALEKQFARQTYGNRGLLMLKRDQPIEDDITKYRNADYYCYFSPKNYYGSNYIMDCMIALTYVDVNIIGKGKYITYQNGIYIENSCEEYQYEQKLYGDRCIVSYVKAKEKILSNWVRTAEKTVFEGAFGIDCLNFCEGYIKDRCAYVDDLAVDTGTELRKFYELAEVNSENIKFQHQVSIKQFKASLHPVDETVVIKDVQKGKETEGIAIEAGARNINTLFLESGLRFSAMEYAREGNTSIFISSISQGNAAVVVTVLAKDGKMIKRKVLNLNSFTSMVMPKEADEFYFSVMLGSYAKIKIKNIFINLNI